jgi:chromosomal replication initiation ATPase DnaA
MQKPLGSLLRDDVATRDKLTRIAHLCAHAWGVRREEIERFPCQGEARLWARRVAIALSRQILLTGLERLALHFGGEAEWIAAACNRVAEKAERDPEFRTTLQFLERACSAALGSS